MKRWFYVLFMFWCWVSAFAQRQVETIGQAAPNAGQAVISARQAAITDALRNAVEEGVGVFLTSETQIKNAELLEDKIYKRAQGFARLDRIVSEGAVSSIYQVRIVASVDGRAIATNLRSIIQGFNDPRIAVVISESVEGERNWQGAAAGISLAKALGDVGYRVVDQRQIEQNVPREELIALTESPRALAQLATRLKVDMILGGRAKATKLTNPPAALVRNNLIPFQGIVELSLVDALTAQVVWTDSFDGLNYDATVETAVAATFKTISETAGLAVVSRLNQWIQGGMASAPVYLLRVSGFRNFSSFNTFLQRLGAAAGVQNLQPRDFDAAGTLVEIEFKGKVEELAVLLESFGIEVIAITGREIRARAK
jgi:hypothetical protein